MSTAANRSSGASPSHPRPAHPVLCWAARIIGIGAAVWVALRFLPAPLDHVGPIPALVSATPWLIIPLALALALAAVGRARIIAALMVACLMLQACWQLPFYLDTSRRLSDEALEASGTYEPEATAGKTAAAGEPGTADAPGVADTAAAANAAGTAAPSAVRAMTLNTYFGQADVDQLCAIVAEQDVDVLALEEVTPELTARLQASELPNLLPHRIGEERGQQIWSRLPLEDEAANETGFEVSPACAASVRLAGRERLRFVAIHTTAPVGRRGAQWAASIALVGQLGQQPYRQGDARYVLMGDFNATMDHRVFREMLGERFVDAAQASGAGLDFTWPSNHPGIPQLIAIDHMVLDQGVRAADMQTITVAGSDHQALLFTLGVEP